MPTTPSSEHTDQPTPRSVYDSCDPVYLRKLREDAGIDIVVLARTACLSVAQVRQLETDDNEHLFYSDAIKRQAYKRLLMILGAEPPSIEVPPDLRDVAQVADAHLNTLDQIVAMSHLPAMERSSAEVMRSGFAKLKAHQAFIGALLLLAGAVVLLVWQSQRPPQVKSIEAPPITTAPITATPATTAPVTTAPVTVASSDPPKLVEPVVTPASTAAASVRDKPLGCEYVNESMPEITPLIKAKEGRYVYLVSGADAHVCLVDGNQKATALHLKSGESLSVYGVSPWQVSSPQLSKLQLYFQGGRVSLPEASTRVKLLEAPISR